MSYDRRRADRRAATPLLLDLWDDTVKKLYPALVEAVTVIGAWLFSRPAWRQPVQLRPCGRLRAGDDPLSAVANIAGPGGRRSVKIEDSTPDPGATC